VVRQEGPACHTNRRSCFYTSVMDGEEKELMQPLKLAKAYKAEQ
jgi:phosphoribosyl-AMP cyclohydrolase